MSPSVLPVLSPRGSKYPSGAVCPASPSALPEPTKPMESDLIDERRTFLDGQKATAVVASVVISAHLNITSAIKVDMNKPLQLRTIFT